MQCIAMRPWRPGYILNEMQIIRYVWARISIQLPFQENKLIANPQNLNLAFLNKNGLLLKLPSKASTICNLLTLTES